MVKKRGGKAKIAAGAPRPTVKFEKDISKLSNQELRELLMVNMYKMALLRAQLEAVTNVLIKNKLTNYEEVWHQTNENFKNTI